MTADWRRVVVDSFLEKQRYGLLAAISSLKRVAQIPDAPYIPDVVFPLGHGFEGIVRVKVHTTEPDSAELLGNLIGKALISPYTERQLQAHPDKDPRHTLSVSRKEDNWFEIEFQVPEEKLNQLTSAVKKSIEALIAPAAWLLPYSR